MKFIILTILLSAVALHAYPYGLGLSGIGRIGAGIGGGIGTGVGGALGVGAGLGIRGANVVGQGALGLGVGAAGLGSGLATGVGSGLASGLEAGLGLGSELGVGGGLGLESGLGLASGVGLGGGSRGHAAYANGGQVGNNQIVAGASGIGNQGHVNEGAGGFHNQGHHQSKVTSITQAEQSDGHNIGGGAQNLNAGHVGNGFDRYQNRANQFGNQFGRGEQGHQSILL